MPVKQEKTGQASTNSYVELLKARVIDLEYTSLVLSNSDAADDVDYRILVSNDPEGITSSFAALELDSEGNIEATLGEGEKRPFTLSGQFAWVLVEIKSTVTDHAGIGNCWLMAT